MFFGLSKKLRHSLSLRLAVLFCASFAACLIFAFVFAYLQLSYSLEKSSREVISAKWREISVVYSTEGQAGLKAFLSAEENQVRNAPFMIRLMTEDGGALFIKSAAQNGKFDFKNATAQLNSPEKNHGWAVLRAVGDEDSFDIFTDQVSDDVFLQIGRSSEDREDILEHLAFVFSWTLGILILVSAVLGFWYARRALKPIRFLTETIKTIEKGDLTLRVPLSPAQDELRDLGETFNRMIARIESLVLAMRESIDNVAHDIRTPLSRVRVRAEEALLANDSGLAIPALEECAEAVQEITALVDQVLDISEAEAGAMKLNLTSTKVRQMLEDVIEIYEFVAEEKKIEVQLLTCEANLEWRLDRRRIKQVLGNLLDNAIKYSPAGSRVVISALKEPGKLRINVEDNGIGIPLEDVPRIWGRLFRGDKSRATKGSGLGLSLVRSIILAHGGNVAVQGNEQGGATFEVSIPS
jgi:signal transduction histidine kinase